MFNRRLHGILCEVFKSIKGSNSKCFNDLFEVKSTSYSLHNDYRLIQPKRRTANLGLWMVSYLSAKLWNDNLALFIDTLDGEICTFKSSLKYRWHRHKAIGLPYVWYKRRRTMYNAYLCVHNVDFTLLRNCGFQITESKDHVGYNGRCCEGGPECSKFGEFKSKLISQPEGNRYTGDCHLLVQIMICRLVIA